MAVNWTEWCIDFWHKRQRQIDIDILWPACKKEAEAQGYDLDTARAAFAAHALNDHAWLVLGDDEVVRRVKELS